MPPVSLHVSPWRMGQLEHSRRVDAVLQKNLSRCCALLRIRDHNSFHYEMFILHHRCYKKLPNGVIYKKNTGNSQTVLIRLCTNETCPHLFPLPSSMWGTGSTQLKEVFLIENCFFSLQISSSLSLHSMEKTTALKEIKKYILS